MKLTPVSLSDIPDIRRGYAWAYAQNTVAKFLASGVEVAQVSDFPDKPVKTIYAALAQAAHRTAGKCAVIKRGEIIYLVRTKPEVE